MKKVIKIALITLVSLILLALIAFRIFIYKVENGFAKVETTPHNIDIPDSTPSILLFSKTTGFRHGESIDASKGPLENMALNNGWFIYETENAGIVNKVELDKFDIVIWNNSTGVALTEEQRTLMQKHIESGAGFIGIHGAGDGSHHWDFYIDQLIGAKFSHHPIKTQIQQADVILNTQADSVLTHGLQSTWHHSEEWYIFYDHPEDKGFNVLYQINGNDIDTNGNIPLLASGKEFGMGEKHPVAWYKEVGQGRSFYTSVGHQGVAFSDENLIKMIENAIKWELL